METLCPVCILAGGRGTRLGGLVEEIPKPLLRVAGEPFLLHQLRLLRQYGARRIVICVGYLGERIEEAVGNGQDLGLEILYSYDAAPGAGTAAAVLGALPLLGDEFLVLYGDTYLRIDYADVARAFHSGGLPALMTVLRNSGRWGTSNAVYENGLVLRYDKRASEAAMQWIDYGLGALSPRALEIGAPGASDLADVYRELAEQRLLAGYVATERFYEIGTPEALRETEAFLADSAPPRTLK